MLTIKTTVITFTYCALLKFLPQQRPSLHQVLLWRALFTETCFLSTAAVLGSVLQMGLISCRPHTILKGCVAFIVLNSARVYLSNYICKNQPTYAFFWGPTQPEMSKHTNDQVLWSVPGIRPLTRWSQLVHAELWLNSNRRSLTFCFLSPDRRHMCSTHVTMCVHVFM